ncbi:EF hand [Ostertagia ostertagi]
MVERVVLQVSWHEYKPHYLSKDSHKDGHDHENVNDIDSVAGGERASFDRADLNNNGLLDSEEWLRFFHPEHNKDSLKEMAGDILKLYDLDGDGKVTREEFSASRPSEKGDDDKSLQKRKAEREAEFNKQIDANGDGVATIDEIFEYINPQNAKSLAAEASELIDAIDSDGDRRLTLDELLKQDRLVEFSPLLSVAETLHDDL